MRDLLNVAVERRKPLMTPGTDALRLVDGAGDRLPGLYLEAYAGHWLLASMAGEVSTPVREWIRERGVSCYWKRLDQHQKENPLWLSGERIEAPWLIRENGIAFEVSFQSGYSQGIFLDQRVNRAAVHQRIRPGQRLLNAFAYTGGFSVAAAMAGAETTTLDLSQPYLEWAKRNFRHNGLDPDQHHFCKGDAFHWLRRFARQQRKFDAVVLDPPTFSRDDKGAVFRVENDFGHLAGLAAAVLEPGGWMLCCTNFRRMTPRQFERQLGAGLPYPMQAVHSEMPPDFTDEPYLKSIWLG